MKTLITVYHGSMCEQSQEDFINDFNKYYKPIGFSLHMNFARIEKTFNTGVNLNIGDSITVKGLGMMIVHFKYYHIDKDTMCYDLIEE